MNNNINVINGAYATLEIFTNSTCQINAKAYIICNERITPISTKLWCPTYSGKITYKKFTNASEFYSSIKYF